MSEEEETSNRCPDIPLADYCEWDRELLPWLHSACRSSGYPVADFNYSNCTLSGGVWFEDRFDLQYLRQHRRRPLSQYRHCYSSTYQDSFGKNKFVSPLPKNRDDILPVFPGHQPSLLSNIEKANYCASQSVFRTDYINPQLRFEKMNPCSCHGPGILCPHIAKPKPIRNPALI